MSIIHDFKSIGRTLARNEQKADFEEKNPKVDPNKVVWSPEWGYGLTAPYGVSPCMEAIRELAAFQAEEKAAISFALFGPGIGL